MSARTRVRATGREAAADAASVKQPFWRERVGAYHAPKPPSWERLDALIVAGLVLHTHDVDVAVALVTALPHDEVPDPIWAPRLIWVRRVLCDCGRGHAFHYYLIDEVPGEALSSSPDRYAEPGRRGAIPAVEFCH